MRVQQRVALQQRVQAHAIAGSGRQIERGRCRRRCAAHGCGAVQGVLPPKSAAAAVAASLASGAAKMAPSVSHAQQRRRTRPRAALHKTRQRPPPGHSVGAAQQLAR
jgi:hypothetical protein